MEWTGWITAWIPTLLLAAGLFVARNWIKASIEKGIQSKFDSKLENLRADLRKNEEAFKSDLRSKEAEILALRDGVLSGRSNRQSLLDKRHLEAAERLWAAVIALAPYELLSASMAVFKFDAVAKRTPHEPKLRKIFEVLGNQAPSPDKIDNPAKNERLFVSPIAWAYFSAYQAIVMGAYMRAKALEIGIEEPGEFFNTEHVRGLLKATLPHRGEFIEKQDSAAYHHLLEELKEKLLAELKRMLEGADIDQASIARSAEIMEKVKEVVAENTEQRPRA